MTRAVAVAALALAGCDKPDVASGPGQVSMGETRALDEAAQMLDARRPMPTDVASETVPTDRP